MYLNGIWAIGPFKGPSSFGARINPAVHGLYRKPEPGRIAQSVTCLTAECRSRVATSIPARSHTFVESDHEIISSASLPTSTDSRRVVAIFNL